VRTVIVIAAAFLLAFVVAVSSTNSKGITLEEVELASLTEYYGRAKGLTEIERRIFSTALDATQFIQHEKLHQ